MIKNIFVFALLFSIFFAMGPVHSEEDWYDSIQSPFAKWDAKEQTFTFTGSFAAELKKSLPPLHSMMSDLDPKLTPSLQKHFRGIVVRDPAGNALAIECDSGKIEYISGSEYQVKDIPEPTCKVTYLNKAKAALFPNKVSPVSEIIKKTEAANQIK